MTRQELPARDHRDDDHEELTGTVQQQPCDHNRQGEVSPLSFSQAVRANHVQVTLRVVLHCRNHRCPVIRFCDFTKSHNHIISTFFWTL